MKIFLIYIAVLAVMSFIALLAYFSDKRRAKKGKWRISEAFLLALGFFGGAVGALLGMNLFRHKTKHWYFWAVNILALILQAGAAIYIYINFVQ